MGGIFLKRRNVWLGADRGRLLALLVAAAAFVCLLAGLLRSPRLYPIDYGQYESIMRQVGLAYTQRDAGLNTPQYVRAVSTFVYTHFSWSKLVTPSSSGSLVYGVALVRLVTRPFGLEFSVDALSAVWAVLLLIAVYSLTRSGYRFIGTAVLIPGAILCLIFSDMNFCAILRGLYPQGAAVVFTLLYLASVLRAVTTAKGTGVRCLLPVAVAGTLFLKAHSPLIVFLPVTVFSFLLVLCAEYRGMTKRLFSAALCVALFLTGLIPAVRSFEEDPDFTSHAATYHAMFGALLSVSPDAEKDLAAFGLDSSYLPDIGLSYYEADDVYAHNPQNEGEAEKLFSAVTPATLAKFYLFHPQRLAAVLRRLPLALNGYDNIRNIEYGEVTTSEFYTTRVDGGLFALLRLLWPGSYGVFWLAFFIGALGILLAAVFRRQPWLACAALGILSAAAYLPLCVVLCGYDGFSQFRLYQVFLQDLFFLFLAGAMVLASRRVSMWLTAFSDHPTSFRLPDAPQTAKWSLVRCAGKRMKRPLFCLTANRRRIVAVTAIAALSMTLFLEFRIPHAACVNNGDFGRMMEQIGVTWTSENYFNSELQSNHQAIEQYAWSVPFDWRCLTPLRPTYSLYLFVSIVRLFTEPFGYPLNTWGLSILMGALAAGCIVLITRDLYAVLKRWSLAAGLGLCAAFCSEPYLVWYNGLFGESSILIGMLMSLACAVHLALMPRRGKIRLLWFAGLMVSLGVLLCAKSQMLLALPAALFVLAVLLWIHRPYRIDFSILYAVAGLAMCAVLCVSSFGVFSADRDAQGITTKSNLWHTYFYGIFMISDDPIGDMEELGVDTAMATDIGKAVSFDKNAGYVYPLLSEKAQTAFYDHVSMAAALKWYLLHPDKLWYMMDHAAQKAHELYTGYRVYVGQDYSDAHDAVDGFGLWLYSRSVFAPTMFAGYLVFYGMLLVAAVRRMWCRSLPDERRALWGVMIFIILTGVLQYPLTVLDNGFADNQKQLFPFILCHDFLVLAVLVLALRWLWRHSETDLSESIAALKKSARSVFINNDKDERREGPHDAEEGSQTK